MSPARSYHRPLATVVPLLLAVLMLSGCWNKAPASVPATPKKFTIGVAIADTTIPFLAVMTDALKAEAARRGMETVVLNGYMDNITQSRNVDKLVDRKVDLIIVCSARASLVVGGIERANKANIPVIALNAELDAGTKLVTYVGASDVQYGQGLGHLLLRALPKGGKVAVILGPEGGTPTRLRMEGIQSVLRSHPEIEILETPSDKFDIRENEAVTKTLLAKYPPGRLHAVVALGPQMYVGAEYARSIGRTDLKFIAGDYSDKVQASIKSGALYGTVNQSPATEGRLAAEYAYYWLTGQHDRVPRPTKYIDLPEITKENVDASPAEWTA